MFRVDVVKTEQADHEEWFEFRHYVEKHYSLVMFFEFLHRRKARDINFSFITCSKAITHAVFIVKIIINIK